MGDEKKAGRSTTEWLESLRSNARVASALSSTLLVDRAATLNKPPVVLDIGRACVRCGFAGEPAPRHVFPSDNFWSGEHDLRHAVRKLLKTIFFHKLLVNPKERRVLVCDDYMQPDVWRQTLVVMLLVELGVVSVALLPSPLLTLLPLGLSSGLVVDVGEQEVRVLPVHHGVPVVEAWQAAALGAGVVRHELRCQIPGTDEQTASDMLQRLGGMGDMADAHYQLATGTAATVQGRVRQVAADVLFDSGDDDGNTAASLVLDALIKCPVDARATLASSIVLVGGLAQLPGFAARLIHDVRTMVGTRERYAGLRALRPGLVRLPHVSLSRQCMAWRGGSLFAAQDLLPPCSCVRADLDAAAPPPPAWW